MSSASIRRWHSYIGLFMAPSVLFFALTGAVQIYSLHEAHGDYHPPVIVEKLSSIHKDQVFALSDHHPSPAPDAAEEKPAGTASQPDEKDDDKPGLSTLMLKGFFLLVAICLTLSTAFGLWMGLTQTRPKRLAWLLVITGTVIPLGLLLL